jgi:hypothetical protein
VSAELTPSTHVGDERRVHHASPWWLLRDVALVLGVFAAVGALAGVWWEAWWTAPSGVVVDQTWVPDETGLQGLFDGTGHFVVVALLCGTVAGAACAFYVDRVEILTLVTVVVGSVLATWLMLQVGTALAPPDPAALARTAADGTPLPGTLRVAGDGALVSLPVGALTGLVVVFIGLTPTRSSAG